MTCDRCAKPISPGEKCIQRDIETVSGPGATVVLHDPPCAPVRRLVDRYPARY